MAVVAIGVLPETEMGLYLPAVFGYHYRSEWFWKRAFSGKVARQSILRPQLENNSEI
jgi:hypothetical protein